VEEWYYPLPLSLFEPHRQHLWRKIATGSADWEQGMPYRWEWVEFLTSEYFPSFRLAGITSVKLLYLK